MFFDDWQSLGRILVVGVTVYFSLLVILRVTGNRTLSQMNSFDFIITVAFGSTLATTILNNAITYAEGTLALALLVLLQYAVTWTSSRLGWVDAIVKTPPALVYLHGEFLPEAMKRVRLAEGEVLAAIRREGHGDASAIAAVIMESNGKLTVIPESAYGDASALKEVKNAPDERRGRYRITTADAPEQRVFDPPER